MYFQGSIKLVPEDDFKLIESEMRKIILERTDATVDHNENVNSVESEIDYEKEIMGLPLETSSLHDRIGEMLEQIGAWMDYNTQIRHRITPDHAYQLDVAWLTGRNPEIAVEIQINGNLTEAKDRLAQARKFNYRKVILVIREVDMDRLNKLMRHEPELRSWMEAWSIGLIYNMYKSGEKFFRYYKKLRESVYKEKSELEIIK